MKIISVRGISKLPGLLRPNGPTLAWIMITILIFFGVRLWSISTDAQAVYFQVMMRSSVDGEAAVYFDLGDGLIQTNSVHLSFEKGSDFLDHRFRLPDTKIYYLRFDPLTSEGHVEIQSVHIIDGLGNSREDIALSRIKPIHQIAQFEQTDQQVSLDMEAGANDPQLMITFPNPMQYNELHSAFYGRLGVEFLAVVMGVILLTLWAAWGDRKQVRKWISRTVIKEEMMKNNISRIIYVSLLLFYFIYCVNNLFINRAQFQWDFKLQYNAAKLFAEGKDPYDGNAIKAVTGDTLRYSYPPSTLWFYRLFTWADYGTAYNIFLFIKIAVLIGLILLWRTKFLGKLTDTGFYFFCLLAFNSAMFVDLRAGNINMLEELLLWLGFYFFLEHRLVLFCCFILLSASFKMTPLVFLGLLLLIDNKKKYTYFFGSCAIFLSYLAIQYALAPGMFHAFLGEAKDMLNEHGIVSPSTTGLLKDLFEMLSKTNGISVPESLQNCTFYVVAAAISIVSVRAYFVLKSIKIEDKEKMVLFFVCLVYALIHPRMKDYAFMLLLVPSYFIIKRCENLKAYPFIFILAILSTVNITLPATALIYGLLWNYYPILIAYLMWGLYLHKIFASAKRQWEAEAVPFSVKKINSVINEGKQPQDSVSRS
jgi:hypothetical protein